MGYWSKRKKITRAKIFVKISLLTFAFLFFISFFYDTNKNINILESFRFHFFVLFVFFSLYTAIKNFKSLSFCFIFLALASYFSIEYNGNILISDSFKGGKKIDILYGFDSKSAVAQAEKYKTDIAMFNKTVDGQILVGSFTLNDINVIEEGIYSLDYNYNIYYFSGKLNDSEIMFINVAFQDIDYQASKKVFKNLEDFINMQNVPVIVIGDFGIPVWAEPFSKFLENTLLEVKNRIILTSPKSAISLFTSPTINVLGFKKMGLNDIEIISKGKNKSHSILFSLSY